MKRIFKMTLVAGAVFFAAWWLFEDLFFPIPQLHAMHADNAIGLIVSAVLLTLLLAAAGAAIVWGGGMAWRVIGAMILIAAAYAGSNVGAHFGTAALEECAGNPQRLTTSLAAFHARSGRFPRTLDELGTVPCSRPLRGTIVWYRSNGQTYDVAFGDWLVSWHGSDREAITAIK